jgi:hypothetical protein
MSVARVSAAAMRVSALSAVLEIRYAGVPLLISESWPCPLDRLTMRP